MATLTIQIKGPSVILRSASFDNKNWSALSHKIEQMQSGGWYNVLEDDFFMGVKGISADGKALLHWQDMDEISLAGALPGQRSIISIHHSNSKKGFRKTLSQLLEMGMLFPLFNNSIRSIAFDPEVDHAISVAESRNGLLYTFVWDVPDLELFNPEALEFCWVKVNLYGKREFLLFTEVLYKKQSPKLIKQGKTVVKSWELIMK